MSQSGRVRLGATRFASGNDQGAAGTGRAATCAAREVCSPLPAATVPRQRRWRCSTSCSVASASAYARGQARACGPRLRRSRAGDARSLRRRAGARRRIRRALRAGHGRRVPGHQPRCSSQLLEPLERGNTFRVGDELQSIYGFRHASVEVFRRDAAARARRRAGAVGRAARNFRSRPEILAAVNRRRHADDAEPLVAGRASTCGAEPRVELLICDRDARLARGRSRLPAGPAVAPGRGEAARPAHRRARRRRASTPPATSSCCCGRRATWRRYERAIEDARARDARRRRARLLGPPAGPGPLRLSRRAGQPARRARRCSACSPRRWARRLGADALALLGAPGARPARSLWELLRGDRRRWAERAPAADERDAHRRLRRRFAAERARAPRLGARRAARARGRARSRYDEHVLRAARRRAAAGQRRAS